MEILRLILQSPQTVAVLALLLAFFQQVMMNRQALRFKKVENEMALEKTRLEKELSEDFEAKGKQRDHENLVLSSLVKILFEVQKLHIDISCGQDDADCIDRAVVGFQSSLSKHQAIISDNQLYLRSEIINRLYRFYRQLAALLIDLQSLKRSCQLDLAIACVYKNAQRLADEIIDVQNFIVKRRKDLATEWKVEDLQTMRSCCGTEPSPEVSERYGRWELSSTAHQVPTTFGESEQ